MEQLIPTPEEARAIRTLKRLARNWPETLWLFSASGTLHVMRRGPGGDHVHTDHKDGCIDPSFILDDIRIPNDGGDW